MSGPGDDVREDGAAPSSPLSSPLAQDISAPQQLPAEWHRDKAIIVAHSHNLIIALRTNALFSSRQRFVEVGKEGSHRLMTSVKTLRRELLTSSKPIPYPEILRPFIEVSRSIETTGPITGVALSALSTFLELKSSFVDVPCICSIASAALEVKSEQVDTQSHEAVLGRILQVLKACVCHPLGVMLPEEVILKILRGCFAIAMHGAPSEILRHTADAITNDMVSHLFQSVVNGTAPHCFEQVFSFIVSMVAADPETLRSLLGPMSAVSDDGSDVGLSFKTQVAATKYAGLTLVYNVVATLRDEITKEASRPLLAIVQNQLCRALLSVSTALDNVVVVAQMLRTLQLTAMSCGDFIAPQLLAFLHGTYLSDSIPQDAESAERKEVILESLMELCSVESFPVFVVKTYDFNLDAPYVFGILCKHLASQCLPTAGPDGVKLTSLNLCACNTLLQLVKRLSERCKDSPVAATEEQKELAAKKESTHKFAAIFNEKPKGGVKHLRALPIDAEGRNVFGVRPDADGLEIGAFLFAHKEILDNVALGEYVSEGGFDPTYERHKLNDEETEDEFNVRIAAGEEKLEGRVKYHSLVRQGFYDQFRFKGHNLLESMRLVLGTYRLPGEAQRIDRLMEEFTAHWFTQNMPEDGEPTLNNPFANQDSAFIFAFSVIMLNTDLHSVSVETKMTADSFKRNNRGINNGGNVNEDFQDLVYNDIKDNEIKLKDTVSDIASENFAWEQAVASSKKNGGKFGPIGANVDTSIDWYLFSVLVDPAIAALSGVVEAVDEVVSEGHTAENMVLGGEVIIRDALDGLYHCGAMAAHFGMTEIIDKLVIALCKFTDVLKPSHGPIAVTRLGMSSKGLSAISALFRVVHDHGSYLKDSWMNIVDLILRIYLLGCLPEQQQLCLPVIESRAAPVEEEAPAENTNGNRTYLSVAAAGKAASTDSFGSVYESPSSPIMTEKPVQKVVHDEDDKNNGGWFSFGASEEVKRVQDAQTRASLTRVCGVIGECSVSRIFDKRSSELPDHVLVEIIKSLIKISGVQLPTGGSDQLLQANPTSIHATIFSIHLLADLLVANGHRYQMAAGMIENFYTRVLTTSARNAGEANPGKQQELNYWVAIGEHVVISKIRIFVCLTTAEDNTAARARQCLQSLIILDKLHPTVFGRLAARHLSAAFGIVLRTDALQEIKDADVWELIITLTNKSGLLAKTTPAALMCFEVLQHLCTRSTFAWPDNVPSLVQALTHLYLFLCTTTEDSDWEHVAKPAVPAVQADSPSTQSPTVQSQGATRIVETLTTMMETLVACAPSLANPSQRWTTAWLSILNGFANIVASPTPTRIASPKAAFPKERSDSLQALQRSLLATETTQLPKPVLFDAISKVVVPLVSNLCQGDGERDGLRRYPAGYFSLTGAISTLFGANPAPEALLPQKSTGKQLTGLDDLQARVLALLCRAFLHFTEKANIATETAEFMALWKQLLGQLYAYYSKPPQTRAADTSETVRDAVCEMTKNMINVLASPAHPSSDLSTIPDFWIVTRQLIAPFTDLAPSINEHLNILGLPGGPA